MCSLIEMPIVSKETLDIESISFTQSTASQNFNNGSNINGLIDSLRAQDITIHSVPRIRVVSHAEKMWSLDNRRLIVFCCSKISSVDVDVLSSDDDAVSKEFIRKFNPIKVPEE